MEDTNHPIKILVVGEAASIHTAKYVSMLKQNKAYDIQLFSNSPSSYQDELLADTIVYIGGNLDNPPRNNNIFMVPVLGFSNRVTQDTPRFVTQCYKIPVRYLNGKKPERYLRKVIKNWQPQIVISLKMQDDGYVMSRARGLCGDTPHPPWAHFIWGTDIEFFGKAPLYKDLHLPQIKQLLERCDYLIADTHRDLAAAKELGFKGTILGKQIAQGGFSMDYVFARNGRTFDERNVILVKGRNGGLIGKAMNTLDALHAIKDDIRGFEIKIVMATPDVRQRAQEYSRKDNLFYDCLDRLDHADLMDLFARARIAISATDVDGTPGYLLETMSMGALPVHSDMESIREWVEPGHNGLLFPVDDIQAQSAMVLKGLTDKTLFEKAQSHNFALTRECIDEKIIQKQTDDMIARILSSKNAKQDTNQEKKAA